MNIDFDFYNAADELIGRNLTAGRGDKVAVVDRDGSCTYAELNRRINRFANVLSNNGMQMEQRVMLALYDTVDFPICFLGAIKAGVVPIPVNPTFTPEDFAYLLADSRSQMLVVEEEIYEKFSGHIDQLPLLKKVIVAGNNG